MARCYSCGQEIAYLSMWIALLKNRFRRNFGRRTLPVFDCPHCGVECQESAKTVFSLILVFVIALVSGFMFIHSQNISISNDSSYFAVCFSGFFILHYLWWKFVSKLKEPFVFWWENK